MNFDKDQELAARTIKQADHALHGMSTAIRSMELIAQRYQEKGQGYPLNEKELKQRLASLFVFAANYCTAMGWNFNDIFLLGRIGLLFGDI